VADWQSIYIFTKRKKRNQVEKPVKMCALYLVEKKRTAMMLSKLLMVFLTTFTHSWRGRIEAITTGKM
jgi:hypothetical protein